MSIIIFSTISALSFCQCICCLIWYQRVVLETGQCSGIDLHEDFNSEAIGSCSNQQELGTDLKDQEGKKQAKWFYKRLEPGGCPVMDEIPQPREESSSGRLIKRGKKPEHVNYALMVKVQNILKLKPMKRPMAT